MVRPVDDSVRHSSVTYRLAGTVSALGIGFWWYGPCPYGTRQFRRRSLLFAGLLLPVGITIGLRNRRQTAIMAQLPGMADELARSARAGRNLEQSLMLVAGGTPAPLGDELKVCARDRNGPGRREFCARPC